MSRKQLFKVGEVAKLTGLSVRTLHHYDQLGLLCPTDRSQSGYRLYNQRDLTRLQKILTLKGFGLGLQDIARVLEQEAPPLFELLDRQAKVLRAKISEAQLLLDDIERVQRQPQADVPLDDVLALLDVTRKFHHYFNTKDGEATGLVVEERNQWRSMARKVESMMANGVSTHSDEAKALAITWMKTLEAQTQADPKVLVKLDNMFNEESAFQQLTHASPRHVAFILEAFANSKLDVYRRYLNDDEFDHLRARYSLEMKRWPPLLVGFTDCMKRGESPSSPAVQAFVRDWVKLFEAYAGSNPDTQAKVRRAQAVEPALREGTWLTEELLRYVQAAVAVAGPAQPPSSSVAGPTVAD